MRREWLYDMVKMQKYSRLFSQFKDTTIVEDEIKKFAEKYKIPESQAKLIAELDDTWVEFFVDGRLIEEAAEKAKLKSKRRGKLTFTATELDVTDPCYDKDVWCRVKVPICPGVHNYEVRYSDEGAWGRRVKELRVWHESAGLSGITYGRYIEGEVGVDAGLAGFFEDKPNYDRNEEDDAWEDIINMPEFKEDCYPTVVEAHKDNPFKCEGICVSSGLGDGGYYVRQLLNKNKCLCGYSIRFI
ncbi:MAG: DUF4241 domain-containing protein [Acetobacter sp.]|nr:DUF4241 domain-containing protein [Acetobacter sp.]